MTDVLGPDRPLAYLSGPSFAMEIAQGMATAVTIASTTLTLTLAPDPNPNPNSNPQPGDDRLDRPRPGLRHDVHAQDA